MAMALAYFVRTNDYIINKNLCNAYAIMNDERWCVCVYVHEYEHVAICVHTITWLRIASMNGHDSS